MLLTPKAMLTRDDTFINRSDMIRNLQQIAPSISDEALRFELNTYFTDTLSKKKKELSQTEKNHKAEELVVAQIPPSEDLPKILRSLYQIGMIG